MARSLSVHDVVDTAAEDDVAAVVVDAAGFAAGVLHAVATEHGMADAAVDVAFGVGVLYAAATGHGMADAAVADAAVASRMLVA